MLFRHQNYVGACFQAPCCQTWTMTNGNTPCSLINLCISVIHYVKIIHVKMVENVLKYALFDMIIN